MVVHAPLASARPLLNRFRTHTYIAPLPKKFLRALYQTLTRIHDLYQVVRTKTQISKRVSKSTAVEFGPSRRNHETAIPLLASAIHPIPSSGARGPAQSCRRVTKTPVDA